MKCQDLLSHVYVYCPQKSSEWGVKTFSEIMREKRLRKEQERKARQEAGDGQGKKSIIPIRFDTEETKSDTSSDTTNKNTGALEGAGDSSDIHISSRPTFKRKTFTPIVFDSGEDSKRSKSETNLLIENKNLPAKRMHSTKTFNDNVSVKLKRSISPIKFGTSSNKEVEVKKPSDSVSSTSVDESVSRPAVRRGEHSL